MIVGIRRSAFESLSHSFPESNISCSHLFFSALRKNVRSQTISCVPGAELSLLRELSLLLWANIYVFIVANGQHNDRTVAINARYY